MGLQMDPLLGQIFFLVEKLFLLLNKDFFFVICIFFNFVFSITKHTIMNIIFVLIFVQDTLLRYTLRNTKTKICFFN